MTKIMNEGWASYWHSKIMTEKALTAAEIIDYADQRRACIATSPGQLNPYKLGVELFRHIEERWNKGQFGKEWDECDSMEQKRNWDRRTGPRAQEDLRGPQALQRHHVHRRVLHAEFCIEQKFYSFGFHERSGNWEIKSREFKKVKDQLLQDADQPRPAGDLRRGRQLREPGELLLRHIHEGVDLDAGQARDTLRNASKVWTRPVNLLTKVEGKGKILRCEDGNLSERSAEYQ